MLKVGTLVKHKLFDQVGSVHHYDQARSKYWIKFPWVEPRPYDASLIRKVTFAEFVWYRDPNTNRWKIGKNGAVPILFSLVMACVSIVSSFSVDGPWAIAPIAIGIGVILVNYIGLRKNYTGDWI